MNVLGRTSPNALNAFASEDKWRFNASLPFSVSNSTKWRELNSERIRLMETFLVYQPQYNMEWAMGDWLMCNGDLLFRFITGVCIWNSCISTINNQLRKHSSTSSRYRMTFDISAICEFIFIPSLHKTNGSTEIISYIISYKLQVD